MGRILNKITLAFDESDLGEKYKQEKATIFFRVGVVFAVLRLATNVPYLAN